MYNAEELPASPGNLSLPCNYLEPLAQYLDVMLRLSTLNPPP